MAMVRFNDLFNVFQEMGRFQEEFNQLFRRAGLGGIRQPGMPAFNVWSDEQALYVEVDLPGIDPNKLEISVKDGTQLTVQGERPAVEAPNAVWHRQERGCGTFIRELTLPALVDVDKVEAKYENGVLRLTLPKAEAAKPRKIAVKA
jgi:HSP20 family protein